MAEHLVLRVHSVRKWVAVFRFIAVVAEAIPTLASLMVGSVVLTARNRQTDGIAVHECRAMQSCSMVTRDKNAPTGCS